MKEQARFKGSLLAENCLGLRFFLRGMAILSGCLARDFWIYAFKALIFSVLLVVSLMISEALGVGGFFMQLVSERPRIPIRVNLARSVIFISLLEFFYSPFRQVMLLMLQLNPLKK